MDNITKKEQEIIEIIRKNPTLGQDEIANRIGITRSSTAGHIARLLKKGYLQRGYLLRENVNGIVVIGGSNIDIKGIADTQFRHGSSNPGRVYKAAGGVGRNVAENLARLQLPVTLFSIIGQDNDGNWLLDLTAEAGVDVQYVERQHNENTGIYLSILDDNKEQVGSIADMNLMENYTPQLIKKNLPVLLTAKMAFVDTNLSQQTLTYIFDSFKDKEIPIIIDPVSVKKAVKIKDYLANVYLLTPNKEEAEILSDIKILTEKDLYRVAEKFFSQGVKNLVITLGSEGVFVATPEKQGFIPSPKVEVIDTTGAGDAFTAGIIYGMYNGKDLFEACEYGHTMAAFTLALEETVVSKLTSSLLESRKKELF